MAVQNRGTNLGNSVLSVIQQAPCSGVVQTLGQRHVAYRVADEHYETVGAALLWTLGQGLGEDYTTETANAWTKVYGVLSATMKEAVAEVAVG